MGKKLLLLFLFFPIFSYPQFKEQVSFSQAMGKNIKRYVQNSQKAYRDGDLERAQFLYDSLVDNVIVGSYFDNFEVKKPSGRKTEPFRAKNPIVLITYSSWCTPAVGEIPALNLLAKKYRSEVDFVVLFWDSRKKARKISSRFHSAVKVVYVDERENTHDHLVKILKHGLGLPTLFYIDAEKKITDVRRPAVHFYGEEFQDSFNIHYSWFQDGLKLLTNSEDIGSKTSSVEEHVVIGNNPFLGFQ